MGELAVHVKMATTVFPTKQMVNAKPAIVILVERLTIYAAKQMVLNTGYFFYRIDFASNFDICFVPFENVLCKYTLHGTRDIQMLIVSISTLLGECFCRQNIMGRSCDAPSNGYFVPNFDFLRSEAESSSGAISSIDGYGSTYTGFGFARLSRNNQIVTYFTPRFTSR